MRGYMLQEKTGLYRISPCKPLNKKSNHLQLRRKKESECRIYYQKCPDFNKKIIRYAKGKNRKA